jgi:molybdate transport system regulatory protein
MANNPLGIFSYQNKTIVFRNTPTFGAGVARIMKLVKETNSLSEAYKLMGLSSSKGWKIVKKAEEDLGFSLFTSVIGGKGGGQSKLSEEGEEFLNRYSSFVEELNIESEKIFKRYF